MVKVAEGIEPSQSDNADCITRSLLFEQIIDLNSKVIAYNFRPGYCRGMIAPFSYRAMRKTAFLLDFVEGNTPLGAYLPENFKNHRKSFLYAVIKLRDGSYVHQAVRTAFSLDKVVNIFYNMATTPIEVFAILVFGVKYF